MGRDGLSVFAFERPDAGSRFALQGDSLVSAAGSFALDGYGRGGRLMPIPASQEFWHSWRSFQPGTDRF